MIQPQEVAQLMGDDTLKIRNLLPGIEIILEIDLHHPGRECRKLGVEKQLTGEELRAFVAACMAPPKV